MELTNGNNIKINRNVIFYPIIEFRMVLAAEARRRVLIIEFIKNPVTVYC